MRWSRHVSCRPRPHTLARTLELLQSEVTPCEDDLGRYQRPVCSRCAHKHASEKAQYRRDTSERLNMFSLSTVHYLHGSNGHEPASDSEGETSLFASCIQSISPPGVCMHCLRGNAHAQFSIMISLFPPRRRLWLGPSTITTSSSPAVSAEWDRLRLLLASCLILRAAASRSLGF